MHSKILRRYAVVVDKRVTNNIRFFTFCITLKARMMPSRYAESICHVCMWKFESIDAAFGEAAGESFCWQV
jgi:hypothetical protein